MIYLLIGYMWLFVHRPFEIWPILATVRIERICMLACIAYWSLQPKSWPSMRSHFPAITLAVTLLLASVLSPYAKFAIVEDWFKVFVFYILVVTSVRTVSDLQTLVIGFAGVMALYELHSLKEYFNGRGMYRMGTWRMIGVDAAMSDPNSFAATLNYAVAFLLPLWDLAQKSWQKMLVGGMFCLASGCILLTGSRSSLVALAILVSVLALRSRHRMKMVVALVLATPLMWARLPEDLRDRYLSLVDSSVGPEGAAVSAEGRTKSFWHGMKSFAENPLTGAGLGSYRAETGFATHNLYNEAMGELGILGFVVLVGWAWAGYSNWKEARHIMQLQVTRNASVIFCYHVCLAALVTYGLLFILGWGAHNLQRYTWLWIGAFSGIALNCLRHASHAPAYEAGAMGVLGEGQVLDDFASLSPARTMR